MEDISMTAPVEHIFCNASFRSGAKTDGPYQLHGLERAVSVLEALSESDTPLSLAEYASAWAYTKARRIDRSCAGAQCV